MHKFRYLAFGILITFCLPFTVAHSANDIEQFVLGDHILTLQWLQNYKGIGKARIFKKDGKIYLEGYQEENYQGSLNHMTINGTLKIISHKELEFEGSIITVINYLNDGAPHERNGTFVLKARGERKYWRMQDMTQPDNEHTVTDYIDIFFEKYK